MKMKLFGMANRKKEVDVAALESEINAWLEQHPGVKVVDIKQSSNGGSWNFSKVFISLWYEETV